MHTSWRRRTIVGGLGLALGLLLVVIAAAPPRSDAETIERRTAERTAYDDMGRAERGSREFPTPGSTEYPTPRTPKLTCLDDYATRHTDRCQDWVMKLIRRGISPYDDDAPILHP